VKSPLPLRAGVSPSRVYLPPGPWGQLIDFLVERFPHLPRAILLQRLSVGDIVDEEGRPQRADSRYRANGWLWYYREVPNEVPVPFDLPVLHRDSRLLAVDKPHFMASTPGGRHLHHTALVRLRHTLGLPHLSPMHRLDRETAGVLLFCIDPAYRGRYQALFQDRNVYKEYEGVAVLPSNLELPMVRRSRLQEVEGRFVMREVPGEPNSETRIELIAPLDRGIEGSPRMLGWYRLLPVTGRKHQLRVHMCSLGVPLLNDALYGNPSTVPADDDFSHPLQLLARCVEFRDPVDGKMHRFVSQRQLEVVARWKR